jgi:glutamate-5-semialdehyde dehydrogenase
MAEGIRHVAKLPDPIGHTLKEYIREDGLKITRVSVPVGVIAIIYESRPNVTSDAAALALKSGNVCVLRGGKEAINSAKAIVSALREGLKNADVTENAVNLVTDTSRESATALMRANGYVDMLIPRGGAGLINACINNATVPCIQTGTGICHIYVEKTADLDMAVNIINNAKTSRPSVCNAAEVLLVDNDIKEKLLPNIYNKLVTERKENGQIPVELRLDSTAAGVIEGTAASDNDFDTEFLDYILAVKCVSGVDEAIKHISKHSTGHSEAIISNNDVAIARFTSGVDSAAVYVNASTRFTDGGEFGLGCEMGISTQKLHARGPMGLHELTTYKYIINGNGHIR